MASTMETSFAFSIISVVRGHVLAFVFNPPSNKSNYALDHASSPLSRCEACAYMVVPATFRASQPARSKQG